MAAHLAAVKDDAVQESGTLKSSVVRLARLFLGKKTNRQRKASVRHEQKCTAAQQTGCYGSLARQPVVSSSELKRSSEVHSWHSQESLAIGECGNYKDDFADYYCSGGGNALMSQSVHADLAAASGSGGKVANDHIPNAHSVGWLAPAAAAPVSRPGRIIVIDTNSSTEVGRQVGPLSARHQQHHYLAAAVRAKELELEQLRRTMEQNEAALLQVFEDRRVELEARLVSERSIGAELAPAVAQANRRARQSDQTAAELRALVEQRQSEARSLQARLRAIELESRDKVDLERRLQQQLSDSAGSLDSATERLRQSSQQSVATACVDSRYCQASPAEMDSIDDLLAEIGAAKSALEQQTRQFNTERDQWLSEKRQVLAYQKQLQLNLVQLRTKTSRLAADVEQLNSELSDKDSLLVRLQGQVVNSKDAGNNCLSGVSEC